MHRQNKTSLWWPFSTSILEKHTFCTPRAELIFRSWKNKKKKKSIDRMQSGTCTPERITTVTIPEDYWDFYM